MTLIACTINFGHPFLISDTLITVDRHDRSIQIPAHNIDITPYLPEGGRKPVDLRQKSYVIAPNVCLALAGKVYAMKAFLANIKIRCNYFDTISRQQIADFLEEYRHDPGYNDFAFIIAIMESYGRTNGRFGVFINGNWIEEKNPNFEMIMAEGSGANEFVHQMKVPTNFEATAEKGDFRRAVSVNLSFLAKFMAIERSTLLTIKESWGGGFETIVYTGKKFEKMDRFANVICEATYDEHGNIPFPFPKIIMYHYYIDDLLYIQSFSLNDWKITANGEFYYLHTKKVQWSSHQVASLDADITSLQISPAPFKTHKMSVGFNIIKKGKSVFAPSGFIDNYKAYIDYDPEIGMQVVLLKEMIRKVVGGSTEVFSKLS